ncbi:MAG TPA: argininosuccinate synthase [Muribaculaceae bacterium]|nr:argininosuccinate synthase [Muribaculaceae bacterium]
MEQPKKKVVLAFSGGLDTSFCAKYLSEDLGYEVHTAIANTGGFSKEEIDTIEKKALRLGAVSHATLDVTDEYYHKSIRYMIAGNVLRNGTYPISVSSERIFQAIAIINYAKSIGADAVAHGSTGAGNDQVRFDLTFQILAPEIEIITPTRDMTLTREYEIDYLKKHGYEADFKKMEYSINKGLWGTSIGGKETLNSDTTLPESAYPSQISASGEEGISITFEKGEISAINGTKFDNKIDAIREIERIACKYGIGRDMHIGDTIIGIKGRVGFEAAAPILIISAHKMLEKHTLSKWQLYWKDQIGTWYGMFLHESQYLDPVMRDMEKFLESSQENVCGTVSIILRPHSYTLVGVDSPYDLMKTDFGEYGEVNKAWTADDVKGFTKIFGNQMKIYHNIQIRNNK